MRRNEENYIIYTLCKVRYSCPCALTEYHAMKAYLGSGDTAPRILDLGTRLR
jgi:hypothetical protein